VKNYLWIETGENGLERWEVSNVCFPYNQMVQDILQSPPGFIFFQKDLDLGSLTY
jgi:hypothetical protein